MFFIRIVKIESLLVLAFILALTIRYWVYRGDICNMVSDVECTTTRTQNYLFIFAVTAELALVLTHATAIIVSVRALNNRKQSEPARTLLNDALLTVIGMPLLAVIFWAGWKPAVPHLFRGADATIRFVEDVRR